VWGGRGGGNFELDLAGGRYVECPAVVLVEVGKELAEPAQRGLVKLAFFTPTVIVCVSHLHEEFFFWSFLFVATQEFKFFLSTEMNLKCKTKIFLQFLTQHEVCLFGLVFVSTTRKE
jgi:hypothetical protein